MDKIGLIYLLLLVIVVFCLNGFRYIRNWRSKNPWYKQIDEAMKLSPSEREYRYNERRKIDNTLFATVGCITICLILLVIVLQTTIKGGICLNGLLYPLGGIVCWIWFYLRRK